MGEVGRVLWLVEEVDRSDHVDSGTLVLQPLSGHKSDCDVGCSYFVHRKTLDLLDVHL